MVPVASPAPGTRGFTTLPTWHSDRAILSPGKRGHVVRLAPQENGRKENMMPFKRTCQAISNAAESVQLSADDARIILDRVFVAIVTIAAIGFMLALYCIGNR